MGNTIQDEVNEVNEVELPPSDNRSNLCKTPNSVIKYKPLQFRKRMFHREIKK